jgi:hypothetical protein
MIKTRYAIGGTAAAYILARPRLLKLGATDQEFDGLLPGDELVPNADLTATRAITIRASADEVWPWLAQLGLGRGGFYSYDFLENLVGADIHSADRIVPELQNIEVGDEILLGPEFGYEIALLERGRALVLRGGFPLENIEAPYDATWSFVLRPGPDETTRLLVRERYAYKRPWAPLIVEPTEALSFLMSRKMLRGIKARAERTAATGPRSVPLSSRARTAEIARAVAQVAVAAPFFAAAPLLRRRQLRWSATDAEVEAHMSGDALDPHPSFNSTRAITIDATPEAVWPWLTQIGRGRAGFYSYDLFDNGARPSAKRILPEFQRPQIGDRVAMATKVNERTAFTITSLEANRSMLWAKPRSTWAWRLEPLEAGGTRLIVRLRHHYNWRCPGGALMALLLLEIGDFPMMRKLLRGIKTRAEN